MAETYFVTGTDTGVGKTQVAAALLVAAARRGLRTLGVKPLASGSRLTAHGLRNDDACLLQSVATEDVPYHELNPVALEPAIAPHLALAACGITLDAAQLAALCAPALARCHDFAVVEGAGGWRVPLNSAETLADLARVFGFPVILVVGMRLGCIHHALLTAAAIKADGLQLAGWVANQIDPDMAQVAENIATLDRLLAAPRIGFVPFQLTPSPQGIADCLQFDMLPRTPMASHQEPGQ